MKQNRSTYTYSITSPTAAEHIIQSWLTAYKFKLIQKSGEQFYRSGDGLITAFRCFQYSITGNQLTLTAWVKGTPGGEIPIDSKVVGLFAVAPYRDDLGKLFNALTPLLAQSTTPGNNQAESASFINTPPTVTPTITSNQGTNTMPNNIFQPEVDQRDENLATIAFILSVIGLLLSVFTDLVFGVFIYIIIYALAARGLKTKKRGLAIAAIALASFSILIFILKLIAYAANFD